MADKPITTTQAFDDARAIGAALTAKARPWFATLTIGPAWDA